MCPTPGRLALTTLTVLGFALAGIPVNAMDSGAEHESKEPQSAQGEVSAKLILAENGMVDALPAMINAFFHQNDLNDGTKQCLAGTSGNIIELLFAVGERLAKEVEDTIKGSSDRISQDSTNIMDSASQLVKMLRTLTEVCIDDSLQHAFQIIGQHLGNTTYVVRHLEANIDGIYVELVAASEAISEQDYERFGTHLGRALRFIMLSDAILPEGPPNGNITGLVIDGLFIGFFGDRAALTITRDGDTDPDHVVHTNFRRCLAGNMVYWETIWTDLWLLCAGASSSNNNSSTEESGLGQRWEDISALLILQLPDALARCGLSEERLVMLLDSLAAVRTLNFKMTMPESVNLYTALEKLGKGVDAWEMGKYHAFGEDIGLFLRGVLLHFFKDKYIVSRDSGVLNVRLSQSNGIAFGVNMSFLAIAVVSAALGLLAVASAAGAVLLSVRRCHRRISYQFQQHQELEPLE